MTIKPLRYDLFIRVREVIESCQTVEQVQVAERYSILFFRKLPYPKHGIVRMEILELLEAIRRQREDLRIRSIAREEIAEALDRLGLLI